ncbi:MAG: UDP-3-O-(3-hydroxymyristoyl)glucosamine N-acyltransferase [Candidatus Aminicenantes bacterium]|nr:UDP-3-O-(3-hydroxymyristoyl)glucosamine N-acyltransferase [Candidatus Aminicenantes bacterium]
MSITVRELADKLGLSFEGDGSIEVTGVSSLDKAVRGELVFFVQAKLRPLLEGTKATAGILPAGESLDRIPLKAVLRAENPHLAFIRAISLIIPEQLQAPGVHPSAFVSPSARLSEGVSIGAMCSVGDNVEIGARTVVHPLVSIYDGVRVGADCRIHSHVSLREGVRLGDRVILHNGVQIGGDGFGYLKSPDGTHIKIPQVGTVVIEDDVEIGANSAVDRAALGTTIVRRGTKIDNLVTVAHNVDVGENAILVAQVGIGGSSKIGRGAILSGQVGVPDHIDIGDGAIIAAKSGITKNVPAGEVVSGSPHLSIRDWRKFWAVAPELYGLLKEFKKLKARVEELEAERRKKS